jgi:hypothetical protein
MWVLDDEFWSEGSGGGYLPSVFFMGNKYYQAAQATSQIQPKMSLHCEMGY